MNRLELIAAREIETLAVVSVANHAEAFRHRVLAGTRRAHVNEQRPAIVLPLWAVQSARARSLRG